MQFSMYLWFHQWCMDNLPTLWAYMYKLWCSHIPVFVQAHLHCTLSCTIRSAWWWHLLSSWVHGCVNIECPDSLSHAEKECGETCILFRFPIDQCTVRDVLWRVIALYCSRLHYNSRVHSWASRLAQVLHVSMLSRTQMMGKDIDRLLNAWQSALYWSF